ncbi:hypothetical protein [Teredinibacter turnerae]|uniref:hypothetical protein n=1 Tax=Teredinibacter turnerae TaxID=2426 RepID=UPI0012BB518D|nr:hypothetical protein [Teredinibacter turnerae]
MKILLFGLFLFGSFPYFSHANTTCRGRVESVSLHPVGAFLQFNYGFGTQMHCKLTETWNDVSKEVCTALFAQLLAAQLSGRKIEARYNDDFECGADNLGDFEKTKHLMYYMTIIGGDG